MARGAVLELDKERVIMKEKGNGSDVALARRIRSAGIPIYVKEDDGPVPQIPSNGLIVYQTGGVIESRAFDFHGSAAYILRVVITSRLPQFAISRFDLELPYGGMVDWLPDPLEFDPALKAYAFRGKYPLVFERNKVLNHFADVRRVHVRGDSLEGVLLGIGTEPIPFFKHGAMIPGFLTVFDQFARECRSPVSLYADRDEQPRGRKRTAIPRKERLLDRRDPGSDPPPPEDKEEDITK
jgi:hypothetical protein